MREGEFAPLVSEIRGYRITLYPAGPINENLYTHLVYAAHAHKARSYKEPIVARRGAASSLYL